MEKKISKLPEIRSKNIRGTSVVKRLVKENEYLIYILTTVRNLDHLRSLAIDEKDEYSIWIKSNLRQFIKSIEDGDYKFIQTIGDRYLGKMTNPNPLTDKANYDKKKSKSKSEIKIDNEIKSIIEGKAKKGL